MNPEKLTMFDSTGDAVAVLEINGQSEGWYTGRLLKRDFAPALQSALDRYDEVVENQILSLLDDALADVAAFDLKIQFSNGAPKQIFSLHVSPDDSIAFRTTPVPSPLCLSQSESA